MNADRFIYLTEAKGIPNIIKLLTDKIYEKYINYPKNEIIYDNDEYRYSIKIDKNEIENSFFENLFLYIILTNNKSKSSYYKHNLSNWNDKYKIFDKIIIQIFLVKENLDDLKEIISHELHHAFEDYKRKLNTNKNFKDVDSNLISTETDELITISNKFKNNYKLNKLSAFIYYLLNIEKKANISRLYYELKKYNLTKKDINNNEYQKLFFYKIYKEINNSTESLINSLNKEELNLFKEYIKHTSINNLYSNDDNIFKKRIINYLKNNSEETLKKMRKIMIEYLEDEDLMETRISNKQKMFELLLNIEKKIIN